MRLWRTLLLVVWVSASSCLVHAKQLAVVTDPANTTASLSAADLIKIFRAHTHNWPDGKPVIIVLRDPSSNDMQLVLRKVFHMTPEQARSFVQAHKPGIVVADSDDVVLHFVSSNPGAIGIIDLYSLAKGQVEQDKAIEVMRKVVKLDHNFAIGHEILAQISLDPAEQVNEQKKAFDTRNRATPAEQTVIAWFQNAADHNLIPAITNMNDVLSQYPHDRWLVFLANSWLMAQTQYERAAAVYENSGIPDSPGLINNVAYTYAHMRQFERAFALMDKYVVLMPNDANPRDSYAEILRMAGHYNQAIEHYRAALAINPQFYSSQFGIADTYLLMGDEVRARQEYEIGFRKFPSLPELSRIQWRTRQATTYLHDSDFEGADKAFQALADYAHSKHMSQIEADTYRQMAMYQRKSDHALAFLTRAEDALHEHKNASPTAIQQELSQILREHVELSVDSGDEKTADDVLAQLARLSQNSDDKVIDSAYHGAAGARLFSKHKYKEAIPHLEEDKNNPLSLKSLASAYQRTGDMTTAKHTEETLANFNDPTLEQALVVPAFRKCLENPSCNTSTKNASMKQ